MTSPLIHSIDLRTASCMPIDVSHLLTSDTWLLAQDAPEIGFALMSLWLQSWHQVPAASVPSDSRILARLAGVTPDVWSRIENSVMQSWTLCDDDRFYHPVVAEKALAADEQREKTRAYSEMQAAKGRASAAARANSHAITKTIHATTSTSLPANPPLKGAAASPEIQISLPEIEVSMPVVVAADKKPTTAKNSSVVEEIFEHWKTVMQSKRAVFTPDRARIIKAMLKFYEPESLKLAIDGCRMSEFHMGQNDRKSVHNGIDLIFRNSGNVEKFIAIATRENEKLMSPAAGLSPIAQNAYSVLDKMMRDAKAKEISNV